MFGQKETQPEERTSPMSNQKSDAAQNISAARLLTVSGDYAKIEGTFEIADSLEVECEIGGELNVRGKLVIGQNGTVNANVRTVDAVVKGAYEGNMVATGNVEIAATGRVTGNITTDSLVISKGGFFNGNVTRIKEEDKKEGRGFLLDEDRKGKGSTSTPSATPAKAGATESRGSDEETGELERVVQSTRNV